MKTLTSLIAIFFFVVSSSQAHAYSFEVFKEDLISPTTVTPAKWVLIGGTLATLGALALDEQAQQDAINMTHHYSGLSLIGGTMLMNIAYIAGMEVASVVTNNNYYDDLAIVMFRSTAYTVGTTFLLKNVVRESRPDSSDRYSFPSGHSSVAFSFASVIGEEHPWYLAIPAYAFATGVAYSRVALNRHRLHDVIAGATIGISYGIGIAHKYAERQHASRESKDKSTFEFHVQPSDELDGLVGLANYSF